MWERNLCLKCLNIYLEILYSLLVNQGGIVLDDCIWFDLLRHILISGIASNTSKYKMLIRLCESTVIIAFGVFLWNSYSARAYE